MIGAETSRRSATASHGSDIQHTRISVCCEPDFSMQNALRELQRSRAEVRVVWPVPHRLTADMDILICEHGPGLAEMLPWKPGEAEAALVLVLPHSGRISDADVVSLAPNAVLQRPLQPDLLRVTVTNAWSQFRYERRLRDRVARLDENLRAIREVERAKMQLMTKHNVTQDGAYKMLRDMAMQRQMSIAALATALVGAQNPGLEPLEDR